MPSHQRSALHPIGDRHEDKMAALPHRWRKRCSNNNMSRRPSSAHLFQVRPLTRPQITTFANHPNPGTLIAPPISQWPKGKAFFRFAYDLLDTRGRRWLSTIMFALMSRPKPWQAGLFQLKNSSIPPMAKAMYSDMLQAFATGEREKLKALCTATYLNPMLASLDKRPRTKRYKWELVNWTGKARIVAQAITPVAAGGGSDLIRQATVHVPSRQRRIEYAWNEAAKEWEVVSKKEADVNEYIILVSVIFPKSYHQSEWRILSATRPSTVEEWVREKELVNKVQSVQMESFKL